MINVMRERDDVDAIIASYEGRQHGFIRKLERNFLCGQLLRCLAKTRIFRSPVTVYPSLPCRCNGEDQYIPAYNRNLLVLTSNRIIQRTSTACGKGLWKSGYSFKRLVKDLIYDITAHTAFSTLMVRNIGIASFLVSMVMAVYFLVRYFAFGVSVEAGHP